jgi:hypothetical protein
MKPKMFLLDSPGDLRSLPKEVEILANLAHSWADITAAKCIVVESIVGFIELVTKAIVRIFEFEDVIDVVSRET